MGKSAMKSLHFSKVRNTPKLCAKWSVTLSKKKPPSADFDTFTREITSIFDKLQEESGAVVLGGDFNIHFDTVNNKNITFTDLLDSYNMRIVFRSPTRIGRDSQSCVDNFIVSKYTEKLEASCFEAILYSATKNCAKPEFHIEFEQ
ncbi:hypothetical protein QE152_g15381 [Popillia japonica]|uniref:Endonuclease/exonuclease/phosphatase domain-containing protein n=1 Tax=Popillia japonica TaxID=7064 RepID=A0AAW1L8J9_POPJA